MTCPHCEELQERVAWLESELGLRRDLALQDRLRTWIRAQGVVQHAKGSARIVAALYRAHGRPMSIDQLLEAVPPISGEDDRIGDGFRVWISRARVALGRETIATIWGERAYMLTPAGMAKVAEIVGTNKSAAEVPTPAAHLMPYSVRG